MNIQEVISELKLFSDKIISFGERLTNEEIFFFTKSKTSITGRHLAVRKKF